MEKQPQKSSTYFIIKLIGRQRNEILHYSLNCLPILIITMFIKISYDCFWILNMWVLILKLQGTRISYFRTAQYAYCATKIARAWGYEN